MKKIIKTKMVEVPVITENYSDFKDNEDVVGTKLIIQGGYYSNVDLTTYEFDVDDETTEEILKFLESKLVRGKTRKDFAEELL